MTDPVVASDGHTYERKSIEDWINLKGANATSPKTNERLMNHNLIENYTLRSGIHEFREKQRVAYMRTQGANNAEFGSVPDQPQTISSSTTTIIVASSASMMTAGTEVGAGVTSSTAVEVAVMHPIAPAASPAAVAIAPPAVMEPLPALIPVTASRGAHATVTPRAVRTSSVAQDTTAKETASSASAVVVRSAERSAVAEHTVQQTGKRAPVVAGTHMRQRKVKQSKAPKRVRDDEEEENRLLEEALQEEALQAVRAAQAAEGRYDAALRTAIISSMVLILILLYRDLEGIPGGQKISFPSTIKGYCGTKCQKG